VGTEAGFLGYALSALAQLQIELEYDLTADGLLVPLEGSDEQARSCIYIRGEWARPFFRYDISAEARRAVARSLPGAVSSAPMELLAHLGGASIDRSDTYLPVQPFPAAAHPRVSLVDDRYEIPGPDGHPVSRAWSARQSDRADECAVETIEAFRRQGLASEVVAAWMNAGLAAGKVPFYSHAASNDASRALAVHLGLEHVFTVFAFS
jgi:GNAT acetyltransferase-like protein